MKDIRRRAFEFPKTFRSNVTPPVCAHGEKALLKTANELDHRRQVQLTQTAAANHIQSVTAGAHNSRHVKFLLVLAGMFATETAFDRLRHLAAIENSVNADRIYVEKIVNCNRKPL